MLCPDTALTDSLTCHIVQEVGYAQEHDKRTAKKEAARKAVEFLVQLDTSSQSASGPEAQGGQPPSTGLRALKHVKGLGCICIILAHTS